ncbi:hypothetical protein DL96DRAFT_1706958 [Flagelloscypha sp. PMI_526]|nr:hypothetical protein DL96DRAFT_1706958 [Flagelloscypha sp. PMI_526]
MTNKGLVILLWVFFVHCAGIYLFTSGFLLTRLSLSEATHCSDGSCTVPPTHKRAVVLIIDALRFDFVTPYPPDPPSPYHHDILTLPRELTLSRPQHSFLFNAYADPPTTTLQRIKGITTGTLPTFVDLGSNFGASSIEEDSIVKQLVTAGKNIAFMGDDTWLSVFPDSFAWNMTHPFDSFNVEDLDSVDNGVIKHLFPLLMDSSKPFDFLIGHFLGVDHVGHRVGPDHPKMKAKLTQMNDVLRNVVELLDDDTLLVLLGDHGMDTSGDHGGDSVLETSSALWMYSKSKPLTSQRTAIPSGLLDYRTFPKTQQPWRRVQQIDLVPTLSLLLGLPIPFNNLGTVIPELFWRNKHGSHLHEAIDLNTLQVKSYIEAYRASSAGSELDDAWDRLDGLWSTARDTSKHTPANSLVLQSRYIQAVLSTCRGMWAQFNPILMGMGLASLSVAAVASIMLFSSFSNEAEAEWLSSPSRFAIAIARALAGGASMGMVVYLGLQRDLDGIDALHCVVFGCVIGSSLWTIISSSNASFKLTAIVSIPFLIPILHSLSFLSNSFTFWEDRSLQYFTITSIVPYIFVGFRGTEGRLRARIIGFSLLFAVSTRLMALSTVCREEQQPYCHVTFYASSSLPEPPLLILSMALPAAMVIPWAIRYILSITRSDTGAARLYFPWVFAPSLIASTVFWLVEWMDSKGIVEDGSMPISLRTIRSWIARFAGAWILIAGGSLWGLRPLCMDIRIAANESKDKKKQVTVIGFANAFGAPYLLFWSIAFAVIYLSMQLTAQVVMVLASIALLALCEVVDSVRDVEMQQALFAQNPSAILNKGPSSYRSTPLKFADIIPIALLGLHTFYATGHQATLSSIQWKSAFVLTSTVVYPWAPGTVILNSFGPIFLFAGMAAPLIAMWNRSPNSVGTMTNKKTDEPQSTVDIDTQVEKETLLASLGVMLYYELLLLGAATSSAILRRHLMVWKVFAPRFMLGASSVLAVDLGVLIGYAAGVRHVCKSIVTVFGAKKA